jgi:hypothetical protein
MMEPEPLDGWADVLRKLIGMVGDQVEVLVSGADHAPPAFASFEGTMASHIAPADLDTSLKVLSLYFGRTAMRLHADHFRSACWSIAASGARHLTIDMGNVSIALRAAAQAPLAEPCEASRRWSAPSTSTSS